MLKTKLEFWRGYNAIHTRHAILGFVVGGCRLINHNHQDSERLELYYGVALHGVAVLVGK